MPYPSTGPIPRIASSDSKDSWLLSFNQWALNNPDLIGTLHARNLFAIIEAASPNNIDFRLDMLTKIYQFSDSNQAVVEGLEAMVDVLKTELNYLDESIGTCIAEFVFSSPKLVDTYMAMEEHARRTTSDESRVAAIMTFYHAWPPGFAYLLRLRAVHTRRVETLKSKRGLVIAGRLNYARPEAWSSLLWDDSANPHGFGYERAPVSDGLADFHPPRFPSLVSNEVLRSVLSSAFVRFERRRSSLARLSNNRGTLSDYLAIAFIDKWYHSFADWLDHTLPRLRDSNPVCAQEWARVNADFKEMHNGWVAEADFQGPHILVTKTARFWMSRDNKQVHRELGNFLLPSQHTPLRIDPN